MAGREALRFERSEGRLPLVDPSLDSVVDLPVLARLVRANAAAIRALHSITPGLTNPAWQAKVKGQKSICARTHTGQTRTAGACHAGPCP